jgi:hypothetical protein
LLAEEFSQFERPSEEVCAETVLAVEEKSGQLRL